MATYTYWGKTYTQSQLDEIAKRASPAQREAMNKQFGTAYARAEPTFSGDANHPVSAPSPTPAGSSGSPGAPGVPNAPVLDTEAQTFKTWYNAYIQAQKWAYDIATQRQNQQYGYQSEDAQKSIQRNREDYARFTGQEIKDTSRQLALNNTDFARSLSNATRAYGQRGILHAWIQTASLGEWVGQFWASQDYFKTLSQRRLENTGANMNRAESDYSTNMSRLETTKNQYAQDRSAGSQAMVAGLQQQGNTMYGQNQLQSVQLAQQQAEQDALDKLYGRAPTTRPNLLKNIY